MAGISSEAHKKKEVLMKKIMLAVVATAALSFPALAQHGGQTQGQPGSTSAQQSDSSGGQKMSPRNLKSSQIEQIQQSLDDKGFKSGQADGKWGPQTMSALKDFQKSQNMSSTGNLDGHTIAALGLNPSDFGLSGSQPETTGQAPSGGNNHNQNGNNGPKQNGSRQ
jgi:peptidoglycan hydrolase-like protein with peptidoglycan-binding domain